MPAVISAYAAARRAGGRCVCLVRPRGSAIRAQPARSSSSRARLAGVEITRPTSIDPSTVCAAVIKRRGCSPRECLEVAQRLGVQASVRSAPTGMPSASSGDGRPPDPPSGSARCRRPPTPSCLLPASLIPLLLPLPAPAPAGRRRRAPPGDHSGSARARACRYGRKPHPRSRAAHAAGRGHVTSAVGRAAPAALTTRCQGVVRRDRTSPTHGPGESRPPRMVEIWRYS